MPRIPKSSKIKRERKRILKKQERDEWLRLERFDRRKNIGFYQPKREQPLSRIAETRQSLEIKRTQTESRKKGRRRKSSRTALQIAKGATATLDDYTESQDEG